MISLLFSLIDFPRSMITTIVSYVLSGAFQGLALILLVPSLSSFLDSGRAEARRLIMELLAIGTSMALLMIGSVTAFKVAFFGICGDLVRKVGSQVQAPPLGWFDTNSVGWVTTATSTSISLLSRLPPIVVPKLTSMAGTASMLPLAAPICGWKMALAMAACIPLCITALRLLARSAVREHTVGEAIIRDLSTGVLGLTRLQAVLRAVDCLKDGWEPLS